MYRKVVRFKPSNFCLETFWSLSDITHKVCEGASIPTITIIAAQYACMHDSTMCVVTNPPPHQIT